MNKWFYAMLSIAFLGTLFFIKNIPLTPLFESPLPNPKLSISSPLPSSGDPFFLEYSLGKSCLNDLSLAPTIYSFKKAELLAVTLEEKSQALYGLIYTYFLAKQWDDLKNLYMLGTLDILDRGAPYFKDAVLMFYISFKNQNLPFITSSLKTYLDTDLDLKRKFDLYEKISTGKADLTEYSEIFINYELNKKSSVIAGSLNAIVPGAGYLYLNQKQSALTAFVLISLLGWCLFSLCKNKHLAAAFLVFSIYTGFFWGSIVGVTQACDFYNKSIYSYYFNPVLKTAQLYPEANISYAP